ncbi:DNA-binding transcriptional regulator [Stappia indica]|uniref:DNA-binding transcriptional regulator n=1 Tax=Stappia indica TaxID=538381 RepID=UPI001CD7BB3C|nr:DNA-binding transcriptional regulator [Stappia indica]MCA1298801.1 DNA-binding transcriptional regulator [Stappia indica]
MTIRSIQRALQVLQALNCQPSSTIAALHQTTGLPKPTLVRILRTFEADGYVENDSRQGGYVLTARVVSLSAGFHSDPLVVEAGRAWAIALTRKHRWPISIALPDTDAVVVRFSTVPDSAMSPFHKTVNMRLAWLTRALGLGYFAFAPDDERELILSMLRNDQQAENDLARQPQMLDRLISGIRARGFATRAEYVEPRNSDTIAVPIFGQGGRVLASLGITYFRSAFPSATEACGRYVPILQAASREISEEVARILCAVHGKSPDTPPDLPN